MAVMPLTDVVISINTKALSPWGKSININYEAAELDETAFGDTTSSFISGLIGWSVDLELMQDFAVSPAPDVDLFALVGGAAVAVSFKPTSAATSATNPAFTGNAIVTKYTPIQGGIGDLAKVNVSLRGCGTLTRSVA